MSNGETKFAEWAKYAEEDLQMAALALKEKGPPFDELLEEVVYLSRFYIETRYPGEFQEFSLSEAQKAYESAVRVKEFIFKKVKR